MINHPKVTKGYKILKGKLYTRPYLGMVSHWGHVRSPSQQSFNLYILYTPFHPHIQIDAHLIKLLSRKKNHYKMSQYVFKFIIVFLLFYYQYSLRLNIFEDE